MRAIYSMHPTPESRLFSIGVSQETPVLRSNGKALAMQSFYLGECVETSHPTLAVSILHHQLRAFECRDAVYQYEANNNVLIAAFNNVCEFFASMRVLNPASECDHVDMDVVTETRIEQGIQKGVERRIEEVFKANSAVHKRVAQMKNDFDDDSSSCSSEVANASDGKQEAVEEVE